MHGLDRRRFAEGTLAGEHFVEHTTEREDVAAGVGGFATHLLGRHVADSAEDPTSIGLIAEREGRSIGA